MSSLLEYTCLSKQAIALCKNKGLFLVIHMQEIKGSCVFIWLRFMICNALNYLEIYASNRAKCPKMTRYFLEIIQVYILDSVNIFLLILISC